MTRTRQRAYESSAAAPGAGAAYLPLYGSLVADLVEIIRGDTGPDLGGHNVQHLSTYPADLPHSLLSFGI